MSPNARRGADGGQIMLIVILFVIVIVTPITPWFLAQSHRAHREDRHLIKCRRHPVRPVRHSPVADRISILLAHLMALIKLGSGERTEESPFVTFAFFC